MYPLCMNIFKVNIYIIEYLYYIMEKSKHGKINYLFESEPYL